MTVWVTTILPLKAKDGQCRSGVTQVFGCACDIESGKGDVALAVPLRSLPQADPAVAPRRLPVSRLVRTGRLSTLIWPVLQVVGLLGAAGLIAAGSRGEAVATMLFWHGFVLMAPLMFLVAPAFWRNVCPLATLNQLPRLLGFAPTRRLPKVLHRAAPRVSASLLLVIVALRPVILDHDAPALAIFIAILLGLAFAGGLLFSGKSGWCTSFCPMLTVERFYGSSALIAVPHAHCRPCVGCVRSCRDVRPAASITELRQGNGEAGFHLAVAAAMPWLCLAFFSQSSLDHPLFSTMFLQMARLLLIVVSGCVLSLTVQWLARLAPYRMVTLHVVAAFQIYYWYSVPAALSAVSLDLPLPVHMLLQGLMLLLTCLWLRRAWQRDRTYRSHAASGLLMPGRRRSEEMGFAKPRHTPPGLVKPTAVPRVWPQDGEGGRTT